MAGCECCDNFSMIDGGDEFKAFPGLHGNDGTTYYPHVSAEGIISWTNDGGKPNPDPVNIKGTDGTSAYQAAVEAGFSGTESEFNEYLSNIGVLTEEVDQQKSAIDTKAGALVDESSGAIASFVPDATIDQLLGLDVNIEPVQDLHGFDAPWPGGAKVSKCPTFANGTHTLANGVTITIQDGKITINGTPTAAGYWEESIQPTVIPDDAYISFNNPVESQYVAIVFMSGGRNKAITVPSLVNRTQAITDTAIGQTIDALRISFNGQGSFSNFEMSPIVHLGSTPQPYSQYSNLCPISGWSAVGIERTGFNVWDEETVGGWISTTGSISSSTDAWVSKNYISVKPSAIYYLVNTNTSTAIRKVEYDANKNLIEGSAGWMVGQYTPSANARYIKIAQYLPQYGHDVSINYPSTDHNYHAYAGNRYTIQLGQTVYGGTLDVVAGKLTVDRKYFSYSSAQYYGNYGAWNKPLYYVAIPDAQTTRIKPCYTVGQLPMKCNYFNSTTGVNSDTLGNNEIRTQETDVPTRFYFRADEFADLNAVNAELASTPLQVVAYLATPIEIQLDPVTIATIANQTNNVWADAGDVNVTYAADIKAYIDRLNQPTEDDMIANSLIASGKYFTVNNRLFLSTASIAAGAQIIPGTNCQETSLAAALNALNA